MQIEINQTTNLYTGQSIVDLLDQEIYRVRRYDRHLSIIMLEFVLPLEKRMTLLFSLLGQAGAKIKGQIRSVDLAGEYGDKILVILPETDEAGAKYVAEKLKKAIEEPPIELRIGTATFPLDGETRGKLLETVRKGLT